MTTKKHELRYRPELRQYLLPTLVYYLKLIELPNVELETYIHQELETNPLLEETAPESDEGEETATDEKTTDETQEEPQEDLDTSLFEHISEESNIDYGQIERQFDPFDNVAAQGEKLYDILMRQANVVFSDRDLEIKPLRINLNMYLF